MWGTSFLLSVFALWAWVAIERHRWEKREPQEYYRGVGIRYLEDSVRPWPGLFLAIDACWSFLLNLYPEHAEAVMHDLWIEVVPYSGLCKSSMTPTGFVKHTRTVAHEERKLRYVTWERSRGTYRKKEAYLGFFEPHRVIVVRQLRKGDTEEEDRTGIGKGDIRPAGETLAFFHLMAAHIMHEKLYGHWNDSHSSLIGDKLEEELLGHFRQTVR